MIPIFIGYDPREAIAYHVCTNSIIRRSSQPVALNPLALNALKGYDEKHTDGSNHLIILERIGQVSSYGIAGTPLMLELPPNLYSQQQEHRSTDLPGSLMI